MAGDWITTVTSSTTNSGYWYIPVVRNQADIDTIKRLTEMLDQAERAAAYWRDVSDSSNRTNGLLRSRIRKLEWLLKGTLDGPEFEGVVTDHERRNGAVEK